MTTYQELMLSVCFGATMWYLLAGLGMIIYEGICFIKKKVKSHKEKKTQQNADDNERTGDNQWVWNCLINSWRARHMSTWKRCSHTQKSSTIRIIVNDVQRPEAFSGRCFSHFSYRYKVNPRVHFSCYLSPSVNPALWTSFHKVITLHKKKGFPAANRTH